MYYLCSENKGIDLRLCFRNYAESWFSHDVAHLISFGVDRSDAIVSYDKHVLLQQASSV